MLYCQLAFHEDFVDAIATVKWTDEGGTCHEIRCCQFCYDRLTDRLKGRGIPFITSAIVKPLKRKI